MKLIREFIEKEIILLIISLLLMQILVDYLLSNKTQKILDTTYNETIDKVVNKTLEASLKFEELLKNYLSKYLSDLKNIGMHSILFNINTTNEYKKLKNEHKEIYIATLEELNKIDILKDFQKDEENIYMNKYDEEFSKITDTNAILKILFDNKKHPELNTIGYYNPNINDQIDLNEEEQNNIKNMISIFKTIYIKRFIMKRKDSDYLRFFIFDKEKMFIYPPTAYNLTHAYFFENMNKDVNCQDESNKFPLCYYNHIKNKYYSRVPANNANFMVILIEKNELGKKLWFNMCKDEISQKSR